MVLDCALVLQLVFKGAGAWLSVFFSICWVWFCWVLKLGVLTVYGSGPTWCYYILLLRAAGGAWLGTDNEARKHDPIPAEVASGGGSESPAEHYRQTGEATQQALNPKPKALNPCSHHELGPQS